MCVCVCVCIFTFFEEMKHEIFKKNSFAKELNFFRNQLIFPGK